MFNSLRLKIAKALAPELGEQARKKQGIGANWKNGPGHSIETYKQMEIDPNIALGTAMIKAPLARAGWEIVCEDKQVKEFMTDNLKPRWRRLIQQSLDAVVFGFQAFEVAWEARDGRFWYAKFKDEDPSSVKMLQDDFDNFAGYRVGEDKFLAEDLKCFVFTHQKRWGNLYGRSRYDPIYNVWWWCECMYDIANRYMERKGDPPIIGRAPKGSTTDTEGNSKDNMQLAEDLAQTLKAGGSAVFQSDLVDEKGNLAWGFEYLMDDKRGPMFESWVNHLDTRKFRGMFIPERAGTQDGSTGSYNMAEVHAQVWMDTEELLRESLNQQITDYIVKPSVDLNFGRDIPCEAVIQGLTDEEKEQMREIFKTILQGGESGKVIKLIDREKLMTDLDIPLVENIEEVLKEEEAQRKALPVGGLPPQAGSGGIPGGKDDEEEEPGAKPGGFRVGIELRRTKADLIGDEVTKRVARFYRKVKDTITNNLKKPEDIDRLADFLPRSLWDEEERLMKDALTAADLYARYQVWRRVPAEKRQTLRGGRGSTRLAAVEFIPGAAVEWLTKRGVVTEAEFDKIDKRYRLRAFTVANIEREETIKAVRDKMADGMAKGTPWNDTIARNQDGKPIDSKGRIVKDTAKAATIVGLKNRIDDMLKSHGVTGPKPHRIEAVYRTYTNAAYGAGQWETLTGEGMGKLFPLWQYYAVVDTRVRPTHAAMNNHIARSTDPIWRAWYPPNGWNCRCEVLPLDVEEVEGKGLKPDRKPKSTIKHPVSGKRTRLQPDDGFVGNPVNWMEAKTTTELRNEINHAAGMWLRTERN